MGIGRDEEVTIVKAGRQCFAGNFGGIAGADAARHAGDQRAFDQSLGVEDGIVVFLLQTSPESGHFPPGRSSAQRFAPAPQRNRDDVTDGRVQARNPGKALLDAPVDLCFRKSPVQIAGDRQVVHDITKRRGFDQQDTHQGG